MHEYGVRDVEKLLGLPRSTIRSLIVAGFVSPARGARNAWRFSFQDLIVLRTARALAVANVPSKRITRSMRELRRHLPKSMPLSGLSICAVADHVVVREGGSRWQADSGQYLLAFESDADGTLSVIEQMSAQPEASAESHFADGAALENEDADAAVEAYEHAVAADPTLVDAHINLGRLLHESGRYCARRARLSQCDRGLRRRAAAARSTSACYSTTEVARATRYRSTKRRCASTLTLADCHYNLALLYEDVNKPKSAFATWRSIVG